MFKRRVVILAHLIVISTQEVGPTSNFCEE